MQLILSHQEWIDFSRSLNILHQHSKSTVNRPVKKPVQKEQSSGFFSFFSSPEPEEAPEPPKPSVTLPYIKKTKGLYIFGNSGTGKTYLMDTFFETVPF
jgi:predicted ATPase